MGDSLAAPRNVSANVLAPVLTPTAGFSSSMTGKGLHSRPITSHNSGPKSCGPSTLAALDRSIYFLWTRLALQLIPVIRWIAATEHFLKYRIGIVFTTCGA